MPFSALKCAAIISTLLSMVACAPNSSESLLNDQKTVSSSLTLDKTPKAEELYLKAFNPTLNAASGVTKVEVAGECYVSTYPSHQIVASISGTLISIVDINPATALNSTAMCRNGRFNFSIDAGALAVGQHQIRIVLRAYELNGGAPIINESQGATTVTLSRQ